MTHTRSQVRNRNAKARVILTKTQGDPVYCHWCRCRIHRKAGNTRPDTATVDHVIPMSEGGKNQADNLVWSCLTCNQRRNTEQQRANRKGSK